ncbi:transmembrane protein 107 like isoform X1 [Pygocentrus nattereri]|uniref:transmembrane protein 107 like isoform X1 n=1 Tax=Pygocentrus nattereri TaxID=42514 RepID=UPI0008142D9D|nr:transmembrane protein 107 like isoform X1 [Pygocentrus nattereri]
MSAISSLVPTRFLTLIAHLVIVIIIFWSRENNVKACLPLDYTNEEYTLEDTRLVVALSVSLGLFAVELVGLFSGASMFNNNQGLLCIFARGASIWEFWSKTPLHFTTACHASGSVALLFLLFEQWTCSIYWWIFGFCSVVPAIYEMILLFAVFGLKKKPL